MIVLSVLNRLVRDGDMQSDSDAPSGKAASGTGRRSGNGPSPDARTRRSSYSYPQQEQAVTRREFQRYRAAVRHDLEWLLNTRRISAPLPEGLKEIERSVYCYGLPDFSQLNLHPGRNEGDQNRLAEIIAGVIRLFEPRILDVKVTVNSRPDAMQNVRFQVSGRLKMKPRPEPVFYDTTLDVTKGEYAVEVPGEASAW